MNEFDRLKRSCKAANLASQNRPAGIYALTVKVVVRNFQATSLWTGTAFHHYLQ
jgi:hypothetical protein